MQGTPGDMTFCTLRAGARARGEFEDRRSRFIGLLVPVGGERDATRGVAEVRAARHDARHNAWAWALADGRERCSDDGEPQRTAGQPILQQLRGAGLANVCCVVTRYFGGTLLGPGGLARAYGEAAARSIAAAREAGDLVTQGLVVPVTCVVPYAAYERTRHVALMCDGREQDAIFFEDVQVTYVFRAGQEGRFVAALSELANGRDVCQVGEARLGTL